MLDEFYVDAEGQLDRVVLQGVARRPISADKTGTIDESAPKHVFTQSTAIPLCSATAKPSYSISSTFA
jgi:hypothetical protein